VSGCAEGCEASGAGDVEDGGTVGGVWGDCCPIPCANAKPLPNAIIKASLLMFFVMRVSLYFYLDCEVRRTPQKITHS